MKNDNEEKIKKLRNSFYKKWFCNIINFMFCPI
jgi:hypothetical protein